MRTLTRKGYARIYVSDKADIDRVKVMIRTMDEFEFEYLPKDLIAPFSEYPKTSYTHKFDGLDVDALTAKCWQNGIHIWVMDNGHNET